MCWVLKQCMLVMQAAYGKSALAATSFFTYVGLGLGFLASTLSLPFGVFVLLCQREPVRYIQVSHSFPIAYLIQEASLICLMVFFFIVPLIGMCFIPAHVAGPSQTYSACRTT